MATPLTAAKYLAALKAEGLDPVEVGSWRTHNRNSKGAWGPVNGVMIHHTAGGSSGAVEFCRDGDADLPGPLCHAVATKDGNIHLVGMGRTNHAGKGDSDVLAAVVAESTLPRANEEDVDGNPHFYGVECVNRGDGKDPWPEAQYESMVRWAAAICRAHGWSARSVIGHLEWKPSKSDPRGFTMDDFRADVQVRLGGDTVPTPEPEPTHPTVSLAHVIAAAQRDPGLPQGGTTYKAEVMYVERALAALGYLDAAWVDGSYGTKTRSAYSRLQVKLGLGLPGSSATDGIPGSRSLTWLGQRTGLFTVTD